MLRITTLAATAALLASTGIALAQTPSYSTDRYSTDRRSDHRRGPTSPPTRSNGHTRTSQPTARSRLNRLIGTKRSTNRSFETNRFGASQTERFGTTRVDRFGTAPMSGSRLSSRAPPFANAASAPRSSPARQRASAAWAVQWATSSPASPRRADRRGRRAQLPRPHRRARAGGARLGHLDRDAALAAARACDKGRTRGLLQGVPFGIKDIFDTADMPTGYGSPIYTGCRPSFTRAPRRLPRAAGGILLGKTVTTEFANRHPGPTANPHNPMHTPGGSSSGSAAAVADFMVPLAIGTQTGGSVIRPAAYCGVVGFKPSYGLFPPAGMHPNTESLDTVGIDGALGRGHRAVPRRADGDPLRRRRCRSGRRAWRCAARRIGTARAGGQGGAGSAAAGCARPGPRSSKRNCRRECDGISEVQRRHSVFEALRVHAPELHRHEALLSPDLLERGQDRRRAAVDPRRFPRRLARAERMRAAARRMGRRLRRDPDLAGARRRRRAGSARPARHVFNGLWTVLYMPCLTLPADVTARTGCRSASSSSAAATPTSGCSRSGSGSSAIWEHANEPPEPALRRRGRRAARFRRVDRRGADPRLPRSRRGAQIGQGLDLARPRAGAGAGARRRPRRAARAARRLPIGVKDIIDTSTCRPSTARRSIAATGPSPTPPASRCCAWPAARSSARR
jgi:hypothetical protein